MLKLEGQKTGSEKKLEGFNDAHKHTMSRLVEVTETLNW